MSKEDAGDTGNNRWWESYLTRYLVGTAYGCMCLIFLERKTGLLSANFIELKNSKEYIWPVLAVAGFAYCYVCSAPLMISHIFRGATTSVFSIYGAIYLSVGIPALLSAFLKPSGDQVILFAALPLCFQFIIFFYLHATQADRAIRYFKSISNWRDSRRGASYVDSYRHLREHGNAYSIVVMESMYTMLAEPLLKGAPKEDGELTVALLLAFSLWVIAPALTIAFAQELERSVANKSEIRRLSRVTRRNRIWLRQASCLIRSGTTAFGSFMLFIPLVVLIAVNALSGRLLRLLANLK